MRVIVFFLVFLAGCASIPQPPSQVTSSALIVHADVEFTPAERVQIQRATKELMSQVGLRADIKYDLDFSKPETLTRSASMIRVSRESQLTKDMDIHFRAITFGWTTTLLHRRVYLVSDVLIEGQETLYLHVVMHELLHLVGCDHVSDPNAVLYWQTDLGHQAVKLTEADRVELKKLTASGGATRQKQ